MFEVEACWSIFEVKVFWNKFDILIDSSVTPLITWGKLEITLLSVASSSVASSSVTSFSITIVIFSNGSGRLGV